MWIDSHCHLNHIKIEEAGSPSDLIQRANDNGVDGMVTICCRIHEELDELATIANNHNNVWFSIGTHPHDAGHEKEKEISGDKIIEHCVNYDKLIGVG